MWCAEKIGHAAYVYGDLNSCIRHWTEDCISDSDDVPVRVIFKGIINKKGFLKDSTCLLLQYFSLGKF